MAGMYRTVVIWKWLFRTVYNIAYSYVKILCYTFWYKKETINSALHFNRKYKQINRITDGKNCILSHLMTIVNPSCSRGWQDVVCTRIELLFLQHFMQFSERSPRGYKKTWKPKFALKTAKDQSQYTNCLFLPTNKCRRFYLRIYLYEWMYKCMTSWWI